MAFGIDKYLEQKSIEAYSTNCDNDEKSITIVLKKSQKTKIIRSKTSISQTFKKNKNQ